MKDLYKINCTSCWNITDHYMDFKGKSPLSEIDNWLETMEMPYKFYGEFFLDKRDL